MFTRARFKLTAWYLLIIMLVSISFSVAIYNVLANELNRVERAQRTRQDRRIALPSDIPFELRPAPRQFSIDPQIIEETKDRLIIILLMINGGIFGVSALAGFFLAGRTLKPIKEMVDEQDRFITDASHELRTPITSLKTEIEVNLRDKSLNKETKKILESNLEEVNNLQALSDNLIKLAGFKKSGRVIFEKLNLSEIVGDAVKKVSNLAKYKHITIKNNLRDYIVSGGRQSLTESFVIFLENAIKYSSENSSVIISSKTVDHTVVVSIKDEGIGISEEDMPHLFERFYRADKSRTKTDITGHGLGLAIAKQIVEKHRGSIKVKSRVGKGTTFEIHLPLG